MTIQINKLNVEPMFTYYAECEADCRNESERQAFVECLGQDKQIQIDDVICVPC